MSKEITQERLKTRFDYHPDGYFICKRTGNHVGRNSVAKYVRVRLYNKTVDFHSLVYCWHTGIYNVCIDHIDLDRCNNKIENLRVATKSQNSANVRKRTKRSPYKGVYPSTNKWVVCVCKDKITKYLGRFDCPIVAALAYDRYAIDTFGEYARTNFTYKREQQTCRHEVAGQANEVKRGH